MDIFACTPPGTLIDRKMASSLDLISENDTKRQASLQGPRLMVQSGRPFRV